MREITIPVRTDSGGGGSDYEAGGNFFCNGDPNGQITADRGATCLDLTSGLNYWKTTDGTNTGWI